MKKAAQRGEGGAGSLWRRVLGGSVATLALAAGLVAVQAPAGAAPYGPYTCKNGFVWRDAVPYDQVCVTPQIRDQAATENALAASRRQPGGGAYGPNTCKAGFVWRLVRPNDLVCVTPDSRTQAYNDNYYAPLRMLEPANAPDSTIRLTTELKEYHAGNYLWAWGNGLIPNGQVRFWVIRPERSMTPFLVGSPVPVNALGAISNADPRGVRFARVEPYGGDLLPAVVLAVEQASGMVTRVGLTNAYTY
ncbi:hypothetical protein [Actinomadura sp. HBU206391]|uniref:hypothetical protein n=1 Tax=Actinomadura sp. HBU206391 TaxID=2731692 RepID=UPI00164F1317|nr:hypothetical protein [Actinomadura sp. HBU206391]MBC6458891.1 hypothetical protein [Actinomadura sp. HBU206391]